MPSAAITGPSGSNQAMGSGSATTAGPPASPNPGPPATPSTAWTVIAAGDADVYHYQPATVIVPARQPVVVRLVDGDVLDHDWTVFDADGTTVLARLSVAKEGDEMSGTFTFTNPGRYSVWCTVPGHRGFGEVGTLIVVP
jgi:plastocyanin